MEKEELVVGSPVATAGITLVPVEKVSRNYWQRKGKFLFSGIRQPVSIVVISASARRAFRITGEEVSIEQLEQEVPDIKSTLEGLSPLSRQV